MVDNSLSERSEKLRADFSFHSKPVKEYDSTEITVTGPIWKSKSIIPNEGYLTDPQVVVESVIQASVHQIVDGILNNELVRDEINHRFVSKEKLRELLTIPLFGDRFDAHHIREDLMKLLKEEQ